MTTGEPTPSSVYFLLEHLIHTRYHYAIVCSLTQEYATRSTKSLVVGIDLSLSLLSNVPLTKVGVGTE